MNDERALIFTNLLNGNTPEQVGRAFNKTPHEIDDIFRFVGRKIKSYYFERAMPLIPCDTIAEARINKMPLLDTLRKVNLEILPTFHKITTHEVKNATDLRR